MLIISRMPGDTILIGDMLHVELLASPDGNRGYVRVSGPAGARTHKMLPRDRVQVAMGVWLVMVKVTRSQCKIGVDAPDEVRVMRGECAEVANA